MILVLTAMVVFWWGYFSPAGGGVFSGPGRRDIEDMVDCSPLCTCTTKLENRVVRVFPPEWG